MKALTIWQPWASLIMAGAKPYEFRGWRFPSSLIGQRIVIHAGARPVRKAEVLDLLTRLNDPAQSWTTCLHKPKALTLLLDCYYQPKAANVPLSAGLGTALLGEPRNGWDIAAEFGGHPALLNDSDREGTANWGWPVSEIEPFVAPLACKGAQGFWNWPTPEDFAL